MVYWDNKCWSIWGKHFGCPKINNCWREVPDLLCHARCFAGRAWSSLKRWANVAFIEVGFLYMQKYCINRGQLAFSTGRYSDNCTSKHDSMFRQDIPFILMSNDGSIFRQVGNPTGRYSNRSLFRKIVIQTVFNIDSSLKFN